MLPSTAEGSGQVARAPMMPMQMCQNPALPYQVQMPLSPQEQPVAHSNQYMPHGAYAQPLQQAPLQWDGLQYVPQGLPYAKAEQKPASPWQQGKYQPASQQVLVLSNFLQEAPRKLEPQPEAQCLVRLSP